MRALITGGTGFTPTPVYRWQILMLFVSILLLINFLI